MKTTVVIPNYNGKDFLKDCLDSLQKGTIVPAIVVVDNGSSDGSTAFIKEHYPQVQVITFSENRGFSAAVNAGIEYADTPYVFLLNNDTTVHEDAVACLEREMDNHPNVFSMEARMVQMRNPDKLDSAGDFYCALGWAFARGKDKPYHTFEQKSKIFSACAGAAVYRKSYFEKTGLFDDNHFAYLEDVDIGYRAQIYGYDNYYVPEAIVYHVGSGASGSRYNEFKIRLSARNSIYLVYKNMPLLQILLNLPFLLLGYLVKTLFFIKKGFGGTYFNGLIKGFQLCCSKEGRAHKVRFLFRNIKNYCYVQLQLWINIIRRVVW